MRFPTRHLVVNPAPGWTAMCCALALLWVALAVPSAQAAGPPQIAATAATDIQGVSALLSGEVDPEGEGTTYRFQYVDEATFQADQPNGFAHATATAAVEIGAGSAERYAAAAISGLTPDTTYRYRLLAANASSPPGGTLGPEGAFTTTHGFGFLPGASGFDLTATEEGGALDTEAGSHPYAITTTVNFNLAGESAGQPGLPVSDGDLRDLRLELPPGLIENPSALPRCTQALFRTPRSSPFEASASGESCPADTQIGVVALRSSIGGGVTRTFGLFNLVPPPGSPAQVGFNPYGAPFVLTPTIRGTEGQYGLTLESRNVSQAFDLYGISTTTWGVPWGVSHNGERGNCLNESEPSFPWAKCSVGAPKADRPQAYLTLPVSCAAPLATTASADSWQQPALVEAGSEGPALGGCEGLSLATVGSVQPSTERASSPSGLDFNLDLSQQGLTEPGGRAPSQIRKAVLALPEGMTLNPSVAAGLGTCTPAQYASETLAAGSGCPNDSKIGTVEVKSPLFEAPIPGSLYVAQPYENEFHTLLALYVVFKDPALGVLDKLAGKVEPNLQTGQLTATFDELPQLPYSHLNVHFREGQRSVLATPSACGSYSAQIALTPWLDPGAVIHDTSQLHVSAGIGGGPCPAGAPPFAPAAQAGTLNSETGAYSPFYLHLTRTDTEQEITSYSAKLPPGLLGKIAGIPYCSDAAIEAAKRESGIEEEGHPSCPAASEIGHTETGYGLGGVLAYAPGRLYLAGPYHGSLLSIVAIDAATVGPFDLGVIVVRSAIEVNPQTAQVSIDSAGSDPIPHILGGIPLRLRDIRIYIDRPNFTLNPTSCQPFSVASTLTGSSAPFTNPKDISATASDPFQVSFCSSLPFAPELSLKLSGPTKRGDYPALRAVLTPHPGDANIAADAVTLPPTEFIAQNHIDTICTRPQSEAEACPAGSVVGSAKAETPLLSEPLQGPVYLRSSTHSLPDLVAVLHGDGIRIVLEGHLDSSHGGLRASFEGLPDAPVSSFTMTIFGGRKKGVLVNAANVCTAPQLATARFVGQNNSGESLHPRLQASCPKHRRRKPHHKHHNHRGGKR